MREGDVRAHLKLLTALAATSLLAMFGVQLLSAGAVSPMAKGDVLLSIGGGKVELHTPSGTLVKTLDSTTGTNENDGLCFDAAGNLYSTNGFSYGSVAKFDDTGTLVNKNFVSPSDTANGHPESCVVDSSGHVFVGLPDSSPTAIQEYSSTGTLMHTFDVMKQSRGSDWLDLAKDQCTIYYTSESTSVLRYDVCTSTQLAPFATGLPGPCFAHRLLSDGSVLVACQADIVHLSSTGTVLNTFTAASLGDTGDLFAMNIDPDGKTFWTADYGSGLVIHANISNGAVVGHFNHSGGSGPFGGLAVVGELTQALPTTTTTASTTTTTAATPTTTAPQAVTVNPKFTG
jgi:hypothetical protein